MAWIIDLIGTCVILDKFPQVQPKLNGQEISVLKALATIDQVESIDQLSYLANMTYVNTWDTVQRLRTRGMVKLIKRGKKVEVRILGRMYER